MKVWSGSAWAEKPAKIWSGTAWVTKPVKVWDGVKWVTRPSAQPAVHLISSYTPGASRNDITGEAGLGFTFTGMDIPLTHIGLFCKAGDTGLHTVKLYTSLLPQFQLLTWDIDMTGKTPGTWVWSELPVRAETRSAISAADYCLVKTVTSGGASWSGEGPTTFTPTYVSGVRAIHRAGTGTTPFVNGTANTQNVGLDLGVSATAGRE